VCVGYWEIKVNNSGTSDARDKLIVKWHEQGYSCRAIAEATGLSERGVRHALARISEGRPGRPMRER
jgi:transposase